MGLLGVFIARKEYSSVLQAIVISSGDHASGCEFWIIHYSAYHHNESLNPALLKWWACFDDGAGLENGLPPSIIVDGESD